MERTYRAYENRSYLPTYLFKLFETNDNLASVSANEWVCCIRRKGRVGRFLLTPSLNDKRENAH